MISDSEKIDEFIGNFERKKAQLQFDFALIEQERRSFKKMLLTSKCGISTVETVVTIIQLIFIFEECYAKQSMYVRLYIRERMYVFERRAPEKKCR